ncbi:uridylate-specific endoribonuclease B-like [Rhinoraja longicauda]
MESRAELSGIAQTLWDNDVNRLQPGIDVKISLQEQVGQTYTDVTGKTTFPLFLFVNEDVFKKKTFSEVGCSLIIAQCLNPFATPQQMKQLMPAVQHLSCTRLSIKTKTAENALQAGPHCWEEKWSWRFSPHHLLLYRPNSSGFEHVLVGETRGGPTVIGFHNWIQFYLEEKLGHVNYRGYTMPNNQVKPDENKHLLTLQFSWKKGVKPHGSCFLGMSPEFEFAPYTIIFLVSPDRQLKLRFTFISLPGAVSGTRHTRCGRRTRVQVCVAFSSAQH